ncbi:FecR family protein [Mastigocoleus testarum]|nr:FecR family protein [Mastigocoleus testarum]
MFCKIFSISILGVWGVILLPFSGVAHAKIPLTRAEIHKLRNIVELRLKKRPWRKARITDRMIPGDSLSTGKASLADLRFNDGSLARVGERAIFRFLPKRRRFFLSNGTALLLIPPGRGGARIRTPNAATAIRGSALFVRYDKATDTTIVGALTDSGIQVSNKDASQTHGLAAGQLLVIVKDRIAGLYDFDLRTFYETSELVEGLDLTNSKVPNPDPAIASVQAETTDALAEQKPLIGAKVEKNPSFIKLSTQTPRKTTAGAAARYQQDTNLIDASEVGSAVRKNNNPNTRRNNTIKKPVNQPVTKPVPATSIAPVTSKPVIKPVPTTSPPSRPTVIIKTPPINQPTQPGQPITPTSPSNPPNPTTPSVPPTQEPVEQPQPTTPSVPPTQEPVEQPQPTTPTVPPTQEPVEQPQPTTPPVPPTQEPVEQPQPITPTVPPTQEPAQQHQPTTPTVPPTQVNY